MMTPRGKITMHFLKNSLTIHGPSQDYKIHYKNFSKVFLLPKSDGIHVSLVIGLFTPLRQGNTSYPFIVFQFKNTEETTITLNLPENENERKSILKNEIENELSGVLYDIVIRLFKCLSGIGVIIPGKFKR